MGWKPSQGLESLTNRTFKICTVILITLIFFKGHVAFLPAACGMVIQRVMLASQKDHWLILVLKTENH